MASTNPLHNTSAPYNARHIRIDNLVKNGDFTAGSLHWQFEDFDSPENCVFDSTAVRLKNNAYVSQTVEVERATPYTLYFTEVTLNGGSGLAQIFEDGVATQTITFQDDFHQFVRTFVTREHTTKLAIQFTGTSSNQALFSAVILTPEIPDPEELIQNNAFEFGSQHWEVRGGPRFYEGTCEMTTVNDNVLQHVSNLVVGATYTIICKTLAAPEFAYGFVYIRSDSELERREIIQLKRDVHEYSHEFQAQSTGLNVEFNGFRAIYDSISLKRISVAR